MNTRFVWSDLSTFNLRAAKRFYRRAFGWRFQSIGRYQYGTSNKQPAAGLYTMPRKFQRINMPSFWMSYIAVDDVQATADLAQQLGGKVEMPPQPAPGGGFFSLIRDPLGAGFTCYEGDDLGGMSDGTEHGRMTWNELFVSDIAAVEPFYGKLFEWRLEKAQEQERFVWLNSDAVKVAGVQEAAYAVRGDKEYWGVLFAVDDLKRCKRNIEQAGGQFFTSQVINDHLVLGGYDPQGAYFYIRETTPEQQTP